MSRQLDLLVAPLGCPVLARDQPGPVQTPEVAVDERVPRLRLVGRAFGEAEVPLRILGPGVGAEEAVLVVGLRLRIAPVAVEDVLSGLDQPSCARHGTLVDPVRRHGTVVAARRGDDIASGQTAVESSASRCSRKRALGLGVDELERALVGSRGLVRRDRGGAGAPRAWRGGSGSRRAPGFRRARARPRRRRPRRSRPRWLSSTTGRPGRRGELAVERPRAAASPAARRRGAPRSRPAGRTARGRRARARGRAPLVRRRSGRESHSERSCSLSRTTMPSANRASRRASLTSISASRP